MGTSPDAARAAYDCAVRIRRGDLTPAAACDKLEVAHSMNRSSARNCFHIVSSMLGGKAYKRKATASVTEVFLEAIQHDFGPEGIRRALLALEQHLEYTSTIGQGRQADVRTLLRKWRKRANTPRRAGGDDAVGDSREVEEAISAIDIIAGRRPSRGQGFGLSPAQRRAVERRAMELASAHYAAQDYAVKDVSARESYDLRCTRGGETLHVEVKGTTGNGWTFLITRNEHDLARELHPSNALVLVRGIGLSARPDGSTIASGGELHVVEPWDVAACSPEAIAYECRVPES